MSGNEWRPCPFCGNEPDNTADIFFTKLEGGLMVWNHFCNEKVGSFTGVVTVYGDTIEQICDRWNATETRGADV